MHLVESPYECYEDLPQLSNATVESQEEVGYSQTTISSSQFSSTEFSTMEQAFDIRLEVIKKSLSQEDIAQSSHIEFYYSFCYILFNLIFMID